MNLKNIEYPSFMYYLMRGIVWIFHSVFYKKIVITGHENIPENKPLILAPNHQNALMDPLLVIYARKWQPIFLARADVFKTKFTASFMLTSKVLPVYRIRDGKEKLKLNEQIFETSIRVLRNKKILALFPETTHTNARKLLPLKKGVQRIVFQAEEHENFELDTQIIPIGLYYSNYWIFRSTVQVNLGKPIAASDYTSIYQENQQKGFIALRDRMAEEIKKLIIHIQNSQWMDMYESVREIYDRPMMKRLNLPVSQTSKFVADQQTIASLDKQEESFFEPFSEKVKKYTDSLRKINLRDWVLEQDKAKADLIPKSLLLFLLFPVFLFGYLNHILVFSSHKLVTSRLKDRQFTSSVMFAMHFFLYPISYLIYFIVLAYVVDLWWVKWVYVASLPALGLFAHDYYLSVIKMLSQWRLTHKRKTTQVEELFTMRNEIITEMNQIQNAI